MQSNVNAFVLIRLLKIEAIEIKEFYVAIHDSTQLKVKTATTHSSQDKRSSTWLQHSITLHKGQAVLFPFSVKQNAS